LNVKLDTIEGTLKEKSSEHHNKDENQWNWHSDPNDDGGTVNTSENSQEDGGPNNDASTE
jgi:hypothetical protein